MAEEERKPLSLNERHQRLLQKLSQSQSRPPHRPEVRHRKVKLEGRRRLCKLSLETSDETPDENLFDSPPRAKDPGAGCSVGGESIRDILDDLTSRLDSLSVEKPKPRPNPVPCDPEPLVEYESAASSLSPSSIQSSPGKDEEGEAKKKEEAVQGKAMGRLRSFDYDEEEEVRVASEIGGRREWNEGEGEDGLVEVLDDESVGALSDDDERDSVTMAGTGSSRSRTYKLAGRIAKMLYPHQRDGLKWLWTLHCSGTGGILGDDMGLGKTMQVKSMW